MMRSRTWAGSVRAASAMALEGATVSLTTGNPAASWACSFTSIFHVCNSLLRKLRSERRLIRCWTDSSRLVLRVAFHRRSGLVGVPCCSTTATAMSLGSSEAVMYTCPSLELGGDGVTRANTHELSRRTDEVRLSEGELAGIVDAGLGGRGNEMM